MVSTSNSDSGDGKNHKKWNHSTKNEPPAPPTITGPVKGNINVATVYNGTTTDPEGDEVWYFIDWGDQTNSSWIGPYSSGASVIKLHAWTIKGTYILKPRQRAAMGTKATGERYLSPCHYPISRPISGSLIGCSIDFPTPFPS